MPILQARQGAAQNVTGRDTPELRNIKALAGAARRDYNYDVFLVVFPLKNNDGKPVFGPEAQEAELVVHIYDKEGTVRWPIPEAIRRLTQ